MSSDLADEGHLDVLNHHLLLLLLILPQKSGWQGTAGCPHSVFNIVVAAVHPSAVVLKGRLDEEVDILLDSGSTISLVHNSIMPRTLGVKQLNPGDLQLVSSAGKYASSGACQSGVASRTTKCGIPASCC